MSSSGEKYFESLINLEQTPFKINPSIQARCKELDDLHMLCYPEDSLKHARVENINIDKIIRGEI